MKQLRSLFRMIKKLNTFLWSESNARFRIGLSLSRASAASSLRIIDETDPLSWEFCGFSSNGEDGILDFLTRKMRNPNHYFIEIGSADGLENNVSWLAVARKYSGIMVEGNRDLFENAEKFIGPLAMGVVFLHQFVTAENVLEIRAKSLHSDPDVFSLDMDGNDYYVARTLMENGFRPKLFVVEYNSAFGPDQSITIEYERKFECNRAHESGLYYGVSIQGWKTLFSHYGYRFLTVESHGVNAFFCDPDSFDPEFLAGIHSHNFRENYSQLKKFGVGFEEQFRMIQHMKFFTIT